MTDLKDIPLTRLDGTPATLSDFAGEALLIVNVASKCGLTPQYEGLETLYRERKNQGLTVLGFPANDFRGQEPGTDEEIGAFCSTTYDVTFPMFSKISVLGETTHPLYQELTRARPAAVGEGPMRERLAGYGIATGGPTEVLWNFEKFLVDKKGNVVGRFSPDVTADDPRLLEALDGVLGQPG